MRRQASLLSTDSHTITKKCYTGQLRSEEAQTAGHLWRREAAADQAGPGPGQAGVRQAAQSTQVRQQADPANNDLGCDCRSRSGSLSSLPPLLPVSQYSSEPGGVQWGAYRSRNLSTASSASCSEPVQQLNLEDLVSSELSAMPVRYCILCWIEALCIFDNWKRA